MPRTIPSGNGIAVATGQIPTSDQHTFLAVVNVPTLVSTQTVISINSAAGNSRLEIQSTGTPRSLVNGSNQAWSTTHNFTAGMGWMFIAASKDASGNFRRCTYSYATGTLVTSTSTSALTGTNDALTSAFLGGRTVSGFSLIGDMAACGAFSRYVASAADLANYAFSLRSWLSLGPGAMWVLDQDSVSVPVLDWTGGAANQSAITGTSVATASSPIGYGHSIILPTRSSGAEHLFRNQVPAFTNQSDGSPGIVTATSWRTAVDGVVPAARFFATTTVSGTYSVGLWTVDSSDPGGGTLLASATMGSAPIPGTWNTVPFSSPVSVTAGTLYRVGVFSSAGRYVATSSFFGSDLVNGNLTADATGDTVAGKTITQGTYRQDGTFDYPNGNGGGTNYFVDLDFIEGTSSGTTANAGTAAVDASSHQPTPTLGAATDWAAATADAHNPAAITDSNTTANAGAATVGVDGHPPAAVILSTAATSTVDASSSAAAPQAAVGPGIASVDTAATAAAGAVTSSAATADVDTTGFTATVSTSSSATAAAGTAETGIDSYGPTPAVAATPGTATSTADGHSATPATVPTITADAGTADVGVTSEPPAAVPVLAVPAGQAAAGVDGFTATAVSVADTVAQAGVADTSVSGGVPAVLAAVVAAADVAAVVVDAHQPTVSTVASTEAAALAAQAAAEAFAALAVAVVVAGVADVGVDGFGSPRQRRPGRFTTGSRRSTLTTGGHR